MVAASKLSSCIAMAVAAASMPALSNRTYADSPFRFNPFSYSSPSPPPPPSAAPADQIPNAKSEPQAEEPRGSGFDPEALERGAKALREINSSKLSKQVFSLMRSQEKSRLTELDAEKAHFEAIQAQNDLERSKNMAEEQLNILQQEAQAKAQMLRMEDEHARNRMKMDHEKQRQNNAEMLRMQEESNIRKEKARLATEAQNQEQQRQTEREKHELELKNIKAEAIAKAKGRAHEEKLNAELNRNMLIDQMNGEKEKWLAAINTTFGHIEGGIRTLLTDRNKLVMTVGGATAVAAGVYTTREGSRVIWGYVNRLLGQPSLIRESSIERFPGSEMISLAKNKVLNYSTGSSQGKNGLANIILHPSLRSRIEHLARATANTKAHQAPFRNMMFYGPPGTGKTMVAREIARKSGLDYAMMTGGDVAPLGAQAVTKIHQIFDWAKKSNKGLLLFIDEADAFLCERNSTHMSEAQRSALNALLFRTGDQSRDIVLVLATNRPGDLDGAITDRMDEVIEFPIPGEEERFKLLKLYLNKYLGDEGESSKSGIFLKKKPQKIVIKDVSDDLIREAARKTEGFSGREIAKLMASVQAAVYGREDCVLDSQLLEEIVDYKVTEHHQRMKLAAEAGHPA
ncbi:hypothetical protein FF1_018508 [Malus domestica]|nr:ATPase family AAA domain-containing protein 3C-like [Malus domestica]